MNYTNAPNVQDLSGYSTSYGGTVVSSYGLSIDYITFSSASDPSKTYRGIGVTLAIGAEIEGHVYDNYTTSTDSWNPLDKLKGYLYG